MERAAPVRARVVSNLLPLIVLDHVAQTRGTDAAEAVLRAAGDQRPVEAFCDRSGRTTPDQLRRILTAAAELLGGIAGLRAIGSPATITGAAATPTADAMLSLGMVGSVLDQLNQEEHAFHGVLDIEANEIEPAAWRITARTGEGIEPYPELCALLIAALELVPATFGHPVLPTLFESCQCDGDATCSFVVRWVTTAQHIEQEERFGRRLREIERRHDAFRYAVAEVVLAEDLDGALQDLVGSASRELRSRVVLALDAGPTGTLLHAAGIDAEEALAIAAALRAGEQIDRGGVIVVDVRSRQACYGRLAAVTDDGFVIDERDVLAGYAQLAATALDSASALDRAHQEAERAHVLLDLAGELATATTVEEVAHALTTATPAVLGCDRAAFGVLDGPAAMEIVACNGFDDPIVGLRLSPGTMPAVDMAAGVVIPVSVDGEETAWLYADVVDEAHRSRLDRTPELDERLRGLAAQAATAIQSARRLEQIRHQAFHDALTGLPNRSLVLDRAEQLLARARRDGSLVSALFIDLDGFKEINDTLGHAAGDQFLRAVSARLSSTIRESDTLARLGGDEFVVLVEGGDDEAAAEVLAARLLDTLSDPFRLDGHDPLLVTASIGVAVGDRPSAAELLRDADIALYRAKARGKNRAVTYTDDIGAAARASAALETELCRSIEAADGRRSLQRELRFHLVEGGIHTTVAWRDTRAGTLCDGDLASALDRSGLDAPVALWALRHACTQLADWRETGMVDPLPRVGVDIPARCLASDDLLEATNTALADSDVPPQLLQLRIGAAGVVEDVAGAARRVRRLASRGIGVVLDPFLARALGLAASPAEPLRIEGAGLSGAEMAAALGGATAAGH